MRLEFENSKAKFYYRRRDAFEQMDLVADFQADFLGDIGSAFLDDDQGNGIQKAISGISGKLNSKMLNKWCDKLFDPEFLSVELNDKNSPERYNRTHKVTAFDSYTDILDLLYFILNIEVAAPLGEWPTLTGLVQKIKDLTKDQPSEDSLTE